MKYYSESKEDRDIYRNIAIPEMGFYVDIGAAHPTRMSNTAFLRDRGWHGIQVDGDPYWKRYWDEIGLELIVTPVWWTTVKAPFAVNKSAHRLSCIAGHGEMVACKGLNTILEEQNVEHIDFMSLDVEGVEFEVFSYLDHCFYPDVFMFEYDTLGEKDFLLKDFMDNLPEYELLLQSKNNFVYTRI